jgi:hypothetical protein
MKDDMHGVIRPVLVHVVGLVEDAEDAPRRLVAHANVPPPVDDDRRQGFLLLEDEIEGVAHVLEVDGSPSRIAERRDESCRRMKFVLTGTLKT